MMRKGQKFQMEACDRVGAEDVVAANNDFRKS